MGTCEALNAQFRMISPHVEVWGIVLILHYVLSTGTRMELVLDWLSLWIYRFQRGRDQGTSVWVARVW